MKTRQFAVLPYKAQILLNERNEFTILQYLFVIDTSTGKVVKELVKGKTTDSKLTAKKGRVV